MEVKINGKKIEDQARNNQILDIIKEHDQLQEDIAILEEKVKELRLKVSICEARLTEDVTDTELEENDRVVSIDIYSLTGDILDTRKLRMQETVKPKKLGVKAIKNMLADLLQHETLTINVDSIYTWLDENGFYPPFPREDLGESVTSKEFLDILTKSVEKTGTTKRIIRNALKKE